MHTYVLYLITLITLCLQLPCLAKVSRHINKVTIIINIIIIIIESIKMLSSMYVITCVSN